MTKEESIKLLNLIQNSRWGVLATSLEDAPYASSVAFAVEPDFQGYLIHVSRLARHTRFMLENPKASLAISENDDGRSDPQTLVRVSLSGKVVDLSRNSPEYSTARDNYLYRFPDAEPLFGFGDFHLFRLVLEQAQFIPGFAQAKRLRPADFASLAQQI